MLPLDPLDRLEDPVRLHPVHIALDGPSHVVERTPDREATRDQTVGAGGRSVKVTSGVPG